MQIRRLQAHDAAEAALIERNTFSMPWSENAFIEAAADKMQHFLVAEEDGRVIAYCGMWKVLDEGQIVNVAVDVPYRRRGVAEELLKRLMEDGREDGVCSFTLEVRKSNIAARTLYNKLGFCEVGIRPHFYIKPDEAAILMTYSISH